MRRLIVNADDFGLSVAANEGILRAHAEGIVTATTCLVNLEGLEDAASRISQHPDLDVGLHLNLTWGRPTHPTALPTLAPSGRLRGKRGLACALALGRVRTSELAAEMKTQLERFTERFGPPSHLDVHQHFHAFGPVWESTLQLATDSGIPWLRFPADTTAGGLGARWIASRFRNRGRPTAPPKTTDHFRGLSLTGRLDDAALVSLISTLPDGLTELIVHPGDADPTPLHPDRLARTRAPERDALVATSVRQALDVNQVSLTTFRAEADLAE